MPETTPEAVTGQAQAPSMGAAEIDRCLREGGNAAYVWDVRSGRIAWTTNASEVLGCQIDAINSARQFANCLSSDNMVSREEVVLGSKQADEGKGVPFHIEYQFHPEGRSDPTSVWVEDTGHWHAGHHGRPEMVFGTVKRIDDRHKRDQQLALNGISDPLTGLFNRVRMTDLLDEAISNAHRERSSCGFAIGAITNLAVVNESYGFEIADEVIAAVANRLRQVMRSGDAVARYSGSKFGFVFNNCTSNDLAHALERLMSAVRDTVIETSRGPVWSTLSLGAVSIPESAREAAAAIANAEEALSETRGRATDSYVIYTNSEAKQALHALNARCATEVVRCLKENTFKLAYQPVFEATTRQTVMHEALLRLADSNGEIIPASHLIPVSEKIGLVKLIDRNVLQLAITTLHSYPQATLSVNISGSSATDVRWNSQLIELLQNDHSIAERIVVDLPELVVLSNSAVAREFMSQLRHAGCHIAVDGFGSGYTSFHHVKDLPVDFVKIDGAFCCDLATSKDNRYFASSLINLARNFGLKSVAGRVETEDDARILQELGIDFLQGNYLAEASIEPPWTNDQGAAFVLGGSSVAAEQIPRPALVDDAVPVAQADSSAPSQSDDEYTFEDGLAKLKATLNILNQEAA